MKIVYFYKMKSKTSKKLRIVLPDVEKKTYETIVKLADREKRSIGKQTEYLAAMALERLEQKVS